MKNELMRIAVNTKPPEVDLEKRILRNVVIATDRLATDGWIILPAGIDTADFVKRGGQVLAKHGMGFSMRSEVIGRAIALAPSAQELMVTETQFADTELGREYAYLAGINKDGEGGAPVAYMRGWSISGPILQSETWGWEAARGYLGERWDENVATLIRKHKTQVDVATKVEMREYSAVAIGADRGALTRAYVERGIKLAGTIGAEMDFRQAIEEVAAMKSERTELTQRIERIEREIQALRGEGASAAAQRNSEAVLAEVRSMRELLGNSKKKE